MEKKKGFKCCICGRWSFGWGDNQEYGNNPHPYVEKGECCNDCNRFVVLPMRLERLFKGVNDVQKN